MFTFQRILGTRLILVHVAWKTWYCLLWCSFSCSCVTLWWRPGDWVCWSGIAQHKYCSEEFLVRLFRILKSSLPLLTLIFPTFKFSPSFFTLSSTLFPPSPIVSPFPQAWLDLNLHGCIYCVLLSSVRIQVKPFGTGATSFNLSFFALYALVYPPIVSKACTSFSLETGPYQSYQFTALSLADI